MSSPASIINPSEIDFSKLTFGEKKTTPVGASFISLTYGGNPLFLQLPKPRCFGLNKPYNQGDEVDEKKRKYESTIEFKDMENDKKVKDCYEGLKELEKHIKEYAKKNCQDLFKKKKMSDDVVDTIFNDFLKPRKDKETGEEDTSCIYFKFKYPFVKGSDTNFDVGFFDSKKQEVELTVSNINDNVVKPSNVKCVVYPNIYISSGKFGITWKVWQMRLWPGEGASAMLNKKVLCMVDSSSDEEEEDEEEAVNNVYNDDDDDDSD